MRNSSRNQQRSDNQQDCHPVGMGITGGEIKEGAAGNAMEEVVAVGHAAEVGGDGAGFPVADEDEQEGEDREDAADEDALEAKRGYNCATGDRDQGKDAGDGAVSFEEQCVANAYDRQVKKDQPACGDEEGHT